MYFDLIAFPFYKTDSGQTPVLPNTEQSAFHWVAYQLFQQLGLINAFLYYVFVRSGDGKGRSAPLLEVVCNVYDELSVYDLMREAGGSHPYAAGILQRQVKCNLVCFNYLDRIDLAIDRALDHPG